MNLPEDHPKLPEPKIGVLLINLGTPDAPEIRAVRRYLAEFLSDPRVVEIPKFAWKPILHGVVLRTRPRRSAEAYNQIWTNEGSPLRVIAHRQAEALRERMPDISIHYAMRYGNPGIAAALDNMTGEGCTRILVVPLYPQYAAATTATVADKAFDALAAMRWQPALRIAPAYYDRPAYIEAIAASLQEGLVKLPFRPDRIIASFHGMPEDYLKKGDPYHCQCAATARLLRERLGMNETQLMLTFQSRFGTAEWLKPYTIDTVEALAKQGVKNLAVITPGFAADCLETLEEIAMENAAVFKRAGGKNFAHIPCLNDSERGMAVIRDVVTNELQGWI